MKEIIDQIKKYIKDNNAQEITGQILQDVLVSIVNGANSAIMDIDNVLPFDGVIDDADISIQTNPFDGGKIFFVKNKGMFAYYREEDDLYTSMWNGYTRYATFITGSGIVPNSNTIFITGANAYIWDGNTLVQLGANSNDKPLEITKANGQTVTYDGSSPIAIDLRETVQPTPAAYQFDDGIKPPAGSHGILYRFSTNSEITIVDANITFTSERSLTVPANIVVDITGDTQGIVSQSYCFIPPGTGPDGRVPSITCRVQGVIQGSGETCIIGVYTDAENISLVTSDNKSIVYITEYNASSKGIETKIEQIKGDSEEKAMSQAAVTRLFDGLETRIVTLENTKIDLTQFATKDYVDEKTKEAQSPELAGYATEDYVQQQINSLQSTIEGYVQQQIGDIDSILDSIINT